MTTTAITLPLPGGRDLDVILGDTDADVALVAQHGTPGGATRYLKWADSVEAAGLRFVTFSRPGYSTSTRQPGRIVADVAGDIAAVLDQIGVRRFVTLGGSGGGPHAIACAALLPDRCLAATALVTIAPYEARGLDWFAGMAQLNLDEFGAALDGEEALREWMEANGEEFRHVTAAEVVASFGDALPPVDQATATGDYAEGLASDFRRAMAPGFDGWIDDDLAFVAPWGFELGSIQVPVSIWNGELDRLVPHAHARWLADRIPGARFELALGHGHFSLGEANRDAILDDLLTRAGLR